MCGMMGYTMSESLWLLRCIAGEARLHFILFQCLRWKGAIGKIYGWVCKKIYTAPPFSSYLAEVAPRSHHSETAPVSNSVFFFFFYSEVGRVSLEFFTEHHPIWFDSSTT